MRFSEYLSLYDQNRSLPRRQRSDRKPVDYYFDVFDKASRSEDRAIQLTAAVEGVWYQDRRPYYSVYPSVLPALTRMRLDIPSESLPDNCSSICVRLPEGAEAEYGFRSCLFHRVRRREDGVLRFVLLAQMTPTAEDWQRARDAGVDIKSLSESYCVRQILNLTIEDNGETFEQAVARAVDNARPTGQEFGGLVSVKLDNDHSACEKSLRLVVCLSLMESDPELVTRDVLNDDRDRYERAIASGDLELQRRLEKRAENRGKVGWLVGASIERSPHYRRPHLAIRWTGQGRTTPKLVAVKGSIVHREVIERVPTGQLD